MRAIVIDVLARVHGKRMVTVDVIGAGPRAVAGLLEHIGVRAEIYPLEVVEKGFVDLGEYDVAFVSGMIVDLEAAEKALKLWRRACGVSPIIAGGPMFYEYRKLISFGYDVVVLGEAEPVVPDLVRCLEQNDFDCLKEVRGIAYRGDQGTVVVTGLAPHATRQQLSIKHSTRVEGYPLYWASRVYVETVRGCSNFRRPSLKLADGRQCIRCPICHDPRTPLAARLRCPVGIPAGCGYCSVPATYGPARSRPHETIVCEVRELVKRGVTRIVLSAPDILDYQRDALVYPEPLTDPCRPPANVDALSRLLDDIFDIDEVSKGEVYVMIENIKACLVDEEVARLLGEYFRGTPVHIGVETGDPQHYRMLGRPGSLADVKRAVRLLSRYGMQVYVYFIYGLPGENFETAKKTVELMEQLYRLGAEKVTAYRFTPLPGTAFENAKVKLTRASMMIKEKAQELNAKAKKKLLGRKMLGIVAGYHRARRRLVIYPLPHGPVTLASGEKQLVGWLVEVRVTDIVSERMVEGVIVRRVKPVASRGAVEVVLQVY